MNRNGGANFIARIVACVCAGPALLFAGSPREIRFSIAGDPKTFDPLHVSDENSEVVRYLTGGVLVRVNRVTKSWALSDGGRAIAFHLRAAASSVPTELH